jgi:hypothetical protein
MCVYVSRVVSYFPTKILYAFLISLMRATCSTHAILDLLTLIVPGEELLIM